MFLQRNTASQVFVIPGSLRLIADGSAVTTGTLTWVKDGTASASAGTLTHISDGCFKYAPTQGETDAKICGFILAGTLAVGVSGSVRTTNADPNDATRLGLTAMPNANAGAAGGLPTGDASGRVDVSKLDGQTVTAAAPVTFPASVGTSTYAGGDTAGTTTLLTRLPSAISLSAGAVTVGTNNDKTGYSLTVTPPTAATTAAAVWDELLAGHTTSGSAGGALTLVKDIAEGDEAIDDGQTPWESVVFKKGTLTELTRKVLRDVDGIGISSTGTVIGSAKDS